MHASVATKGAVAIRYFASCPRGLEAPLQTELAAIGVTTPTIVAGGVRFDGDLETGWRVNLRSRFASRVLRELARFDVEDEHALHAHAARVPWPTLFAAARSIKVEVTARRSHLRSLEFATLRVKDAIVDAFRAAGGTRPDVDTSRPDVRIHLFLDERRGTLYLDTSGEALFKRGWRHGSVDAPLRENLAAGLLALAGWAPGMPLVDPFCGSGTLAIEAAQIAQARAPGAWRHFSFEYFSDFEGARWEAMRMPAPRDETALPIRASDVNLASVETARGNAKRAGAPIAIERRDAREIEPTDAAPGLLVGNPPYGERARFEDELGNEIAPQAFWRAFADNLKLRFGGWRLALITSDLDLPKHLRMTPERSMPLYNGALECRLFLFGIGPR